MNKYSYVKLIKVKAACFPVGANVEFYAQNRNFRYVFLLNKTDYNCIPWYR